MSPAVLLIDENPIVRRLVRQSLLGGGYVVREAATGSAALASVAAQRPDLVLQALALPDMDGLELATRLRAHNGPGVPMVALSTSSTRLDDAHLVGRFDQLLMKPVEPAQMLRTVEALLEGCAHDVGAPCAGRRILVVDDDPMQLRLLKLSLAPLGGDIVTAAGGAAALRELAQGDFDAVVSDVLMAGMDGFTLCVELRKQPRLAALPVVLITANYLDELDQQLATGVGAVSLVSRSDGMQAVAAALRTALADGRAASSMEDEVALESARQLRERASVNAALSLTCSVQAATLAVLGAVSEVLTRELDVESTLSAALKSCLDAAGLALGAVYLYQDGKLTPSATIGLDGERLPARMLWECHLGQPSLFEHAVRSKRPLVLPSGEVAPLAERAALGSLGVTSAALHPMVSLRGVIGVLVLASHGTDLGAPAWLSFGQAISAQLAQGITLVQSFRRVSDSEARYRALMDQAHDGVIIADLEGRIVEVNRRGEQLGGLPRSAVLGRNFLDFIMPEQQGRLGREFAQLVATGTMESLGVVMRRDDARRVVVDISSSRVELAGRACVMAILRDVTARFDAENALARARHDFRQMIEVAPDGIMIRCGETLMFVNPALAHALGHDGPSGLVGRRLTELVAPDDVAGLEACLNPGQTTTGCELRLVTAAGEITTWELSPPQAIQYEGVPAVLIIARDLTERAKLQAQLMVSDRLASVGTLAAGVAHEMNNPLASVLANLDLATREVAELRRIHGGLEDLTEELADARESADRVRNVVRDLKLFSRVEEPCSGPCDVRKVMESSLRMAWNEIRHRARLVKDFGKTPPVEANDSRLGQVFLNLIVNAAQALPEGHAEANEIRVRTEVDGAGVIIEISDTGPGIPLEVQRRLFTPFFTTTPVGVGTGLGLSICQRILTAMGGRIDISSPPGGGTVARVWVPAARLDDTGEHARAAAQPPDPARRGRVLVIDDEVLIGSVVRRALSRHHDVTVLTSAGDALARLRAGERFDVILCDLMMPEMTGMEFFEELSRSHPDVAARVIFLTGGAFTPRARAFLDGVENQRLDKPFDNQSLRVLVNEQVR